MRGKEEAGLTSNRINEVVELSLEDIQGVVQDLVVVSFALGNKVQLLLHCTSDGGEYQLCIYEQVGGCCCGHPGPCHPTRQARTAVLLNLALTQSSWAACPELEGNKGSSYCHQTFPELPIRKVCRNLLQNGQVYAVLLHLPKDTRHFNGQSWWVS